MLEYVNKHKKKFAGFRITWAPVVLRHFSARLEPIPLAAKTEKKEEEEEEVDDLEEFIPRMRGMSFRRPSYQFI